MGGDGAVTLKKENGHQKECKMYKPLLLYVTVKCPETSYGITLGRFYFYILNFRFMILHSFWPA